LTLSLLAYAAVLFTVHVPWGDVMLRTVWPDFTPDATAAAVVVGVFGTTISPYRFFWQASEEAEDMRAGAGARPLLQDAPAGTGELRRIRWDTWSGMLYSDLTAYFIILATAVTLHVAGITDIETAAQAASALRPLAGEFAYILFALGILGVGLIGVPDLAGLGIQYLPVTPMKALFWSAVINGVVAVPRMAVIILLVSKKAVMGTYVASRPIVILSWIATLVMGAAAVRMFVPD
jgi:Mn2+/Fe2+ NRAMP family transporter